MQKYDNKIIFTINANMLYKKKTKINCTYFLFNYNGKTYTISVHHFLSIDENDIITFHNKKQYKNICIDKSIWNEIIIMDSKPEIESDKFIFKNFRLTKPLENEDLFSFKNKIKFIKNDPIPIGWIDKYPRCVYYIMKSDKKIEKGDSGSPIFDSQNKIIGIICATSDSNIIYVLPIIYLIKTLQKKDNKNIYWINENLNNIKKINNNIVRSNYIYYKALGNIFLDIYFLLEGDSNKSVTLKYKDDTEKIVKYQINTHKLPISINYNDEINLFLLSCMKLYGETDKAKKIINELIKN